MKTRSLKEIYEGTQGNDDDDLIYVFALFSIANAHVSIENRKKLYILKEKGVFLWDIVSK